MMFSHKKSQSLKSSKRYKSHFAAASIFAALMLTSIGSQAEDRTAPESLPTSSQTPHANQSESRRLEKDPNSYVIKLDNTKGARTLVLREKLMSPRCISGVGANFSSLAPGAVGEIHVTEDNGILSGCRLMSQDKNVTLQFDAVGGGTPALRYQLQFGIQDVLEVHGKVEIAEQHVRILSSDFGKPGTPYNATCGRLACLNEWVLDYKDKNAAIYFYPNDLPNSQPGKVATSAAAE